MFTNLEQRYRYRRHSALRRHLLGKPLAGPSLPLDVGQP